MAGRRRLVLALLLGALLALGRPAKAQEEGDENLDDVDPYDDDGDLDDEEDEEGGGDSPASHVKGFLDLDDKTFDKVIDASRNVFMEAYATWCTHCQDLWHELHDVGEEFGDHNGLILAKFDAEANPGLAARFGVTSYPTLKYREKGATQWQDYTGENTADSINQFLGDLAGESGTVEALNPFAKEFRGSSERQSVRRKAEHAQAELEEPERSNAHYYLKAMDKAQERGEKHFKDEYLRLKRIVDAGDLRADKHSEFKRRMGILKQFLTDSEKDAVKQPSSSEGEL